LENLLTGPHQNNLWYPDLVENQTVEALLGSDLKPEKIDLQFNVNLKLNVTRMRVPNVCLNKITYILL